MADGDKVRTYSHAGCPPWDATVVLSKYTANISGEAWPLCPQCGEPANRATPVHGNSNSN